MLIEECTRRKISNNRPILALERVFKLRRLMLLDMRQLSLCVTDLYAGEDDTGGGYQRPAARIAVKNVSQFMS